MTDILDAGEFEALAERTHEGNAKWWVDLETKESTLATRDRGRILALITSEASEADEGAENELMDDKLPHLPMFDVEIADVVIRLADIIGAENKLYGNVIKYNYDVNIRAAENLVLAGYDWFRLIVNSVSAALEFERKLKIPEYRLQLLNTIAITFGVARACGIDIWDIIQQKSEFNAVRPDHQLEHRMAEGGKKT